MAGYNEMTPYLASDGVTMYFSSNRPGGLGENDIWMTKRLDDSWQKWSEPVNLGGPINTENWDAFFTLDAGGEFAYLTTELNTLGESDIVRVKLLEKEKPKPVADGYRQCVQPENKTNPSVVHHCCMKPCPMG